MLGAPVVSKLLESVGATETTVGRLLELEIGAVDPDDTVGIRDKVGSVLDTGPSVEPPTVVLSTGDTLGC